jgi:phenylalanyl-tRNA synthetase alpha chain
MAQIDYYQQYFADLDTVNKVIQVRNDLSKTGKIVELTEKLLQASIEDKKIIGPELNKLKQIIKEAGDKRIQEIQILQEKDNYSDFDPTFYSHTYKDQSGYLHPLSLITREIQEIFEKMGFEAGSGPLVESQWYNFTALNSPSYHPSRAMQDTFYLDTKDENGDFMVMRTQTSTSQIRYGESHTPPFRMFYAGQVFRNENIDATHDISFHQIECMIVDENISLGNLKWLIQTFYQQLFATIDLKIRLRPSYFPFTVPSLEVDISNPFKDKVGSKIKDQDWIEGGGAGLVHPNVIKNIGLDPNKYQGLAFGFGIDRIAQLKLGLTKLGQFFDGDLKFVQGRKV